MSLLEKSVYCYTTKKKVIRYRKSISTSVSNFMTTKFAVAEKQYFNTTKLILRMSLTTFS